MHENTLQHFHGKQVPLLLMPAGTHGHQEEISKRASTTHRRSVCLRQTHNGRTTV